MSHSYWKQQALLPTHADIVIVGGGFIGLSTSYWLLKRRPNLKIIIIDKAELGEGASGRNAGFLTKGSLNFYEHLTQKWGADSALAIYDFAQESIDLVKSELKIKNPYTSSYSLYNSAKEFQFNGFHETLSPIKKAHFCLKAEGEISINPLELISHLEEVVKSLGVQIFRGVECFNMESGLVQTSLGDIRALEIIVALNGYLDPLIKDLVKPQRAQMLSVELSNPTILPGLMYYPEERVYFKSLSPHQMIIGGKRLTDPVSEETSILAVNPKIQNSLEDYIKDFIGPVKSIMGRWSGIMGFSDDELPIIEKKNGLYLIVGFSGHGMGFGFNAARNLADMVINHHSSFFLSIRSHCRSKKP